MSFWIILTIAVSLSMDAFSLALAYGTLKLNKKSVLKLSIIVGMFHFVMPIIGMIIGGELIKLVPINSNIVVFAILVIIGLNMCLETFKETVKKDLNSNLSFFSFGLAVSLDSFSVGISMDAISDNFILCALTFSFTSFIFTYFGLVLGKKFNELIGKISIFIGGVTLIFVGMFYLFT